MIYLVSEYASQGEIFGKYLTNVTENAFPDASLWAKPTLYPNLEV